jgi:UV DNA damage endonuclease
LPKRGDRAQDLSIRIVVNSDQFLLLSWDKPDAIENSTKILRMHACILNISNNSCGVGILPAFEVKYGRSLPDMLGLERSPWAVMEIYGGKSDRAERLIGIIRNLPDNIRLRLALENDEYAYSAAEILKICRAAGVPMVFDAHHHVIHEHLDTYEHPSVAEMLATASTTWPNPQ